MDSCSGVCDRNSHALVFVRLASHAEDPRLLLCCHGVDRIHDEVDQHLLELNPVSSDWRQLPVRLAPEDYAIPLDFTVHECSGFLDQLIDIERGPFPHVSSEVRANRGNDFSRTVPICSDISEGLLGLFEVGHLTVEKAQAGICRRYHRSEWLPHLVSDRSRDSISGHQSSLSLAALSQNRTEQPGVERLYLVEQDDQDETAGEEPEHSDGIPAAAEAHRGGVV